MISLHVYNQPINSVLNELKQQTGISFSYNSDLISEDKTIIYSKSDVPLRQVLSDLFNQVDMEFREVNGVVVIYSKMKVLKPVEPDMDKVNRGSITKYITVYDTLITETFDTIVKTFFDTLRVFHHDTVLVYDTLMTIEKLSFTKSLQYQLNVWYSSSDNKSRFLNYPASSFPKDYSLESINLYRSRDASFGFDLSMHYRNWYLQTGLGYSRHNCDYSYGINEKFYVADSTMQIDSWVSQYTDSVSREVMVNGQWQTVVDYFTYQETGYDTNYIPTVDSIIDPSSGVVRNKIEYFSVPIILGRSFSISPQFSVAPQLGMRLNFLRRNSFNNVAYGANGYHLQEMGEEASSFFLLVYFAGKLEYQFNDDLAFFAGVNYRKSVTPIVSDKYLVQPQFSSLGWMIGLTYTFN